MSNSNKIFIRDLRIKMLIGIYPQEQGKKQPVLINADIDLDPGIKWHREDIRETVAYDALIAHIEKVAASQYFKLIETFLESIADDLLAMSKVKTVTISALKPRVIKSTRAVGVEITRSK